MSFDFRRQVHNLAKRALPSSLFGRLAMLLFVVVLASHALVLTVMVEFHPPPDFDHRPSEMHAGVTDHGPPDGDGHIGHVPGGMPFWLCARLTKAEPVWVEPV